MMPQQEQFDNTGAKPQKASPMGDPEGGDMQKQQLLEQLIRQKMQEGQAGQGVPPQMMGPGAAPGQGPLSFNNTGARAPKEGQ